MFAQSVRVQIQPGKLDDAVRIFTESVLPAARQQPGFRDGYFLVDRENNRAMGLALYETKADVEALVNSGFYQENVAKFAAVFAGPPEREVYEVAAQA